MSVGKGYPGPRLSYLSRPWPWERYTTAAEGMTSSAHTAARANTILLDCFTLLSLGGRRPGSGGARGAICFSSRPSKLVIRRHHRA